MDKYFLKVYLKQFFIILLIALFLLSISYFMGYKLSFNFIYILIPMAIIPLFSLKKAIRIYVQKILENQNEKSPSDVQEIEVLNGAFYVSDNTNKNQLFRFYKDIPAFENTSERYVHKNGKIDLGSYGLYKVVNEETIVLNFMTGERKKANGIIVDKNLNLKKDLGNKLAFQKITSWKK